MGYMGPGLPGQRAVTSAADREFTEAAWGLPPGTIRADVGTGTIDMFEQMSAGEIKACWIICTNPVASVANRVTVVDALRSCELVVVQDVFDDNETLRYADAALPAALWTESVGVMVNSERNLTLHQPATAPPGDALPDWELIARVATEMGYGDEPQECWGPEATAATEQMLTDAGMCVWLTFDRDCTDYYDRTLAYLHVGLGDEGFVERRLLRAGHASVLIYDPNDAYESEFEADESQAKRDDLGLWGECGGNP